VLHALPILLSLLAQVAPTAAADHQAKDKAQALLKEGSALYKQADFSAALKKFEAAYALYPSPKLQFNIAQADRELGRIVEAVEAFETFLVQAPDAAPPIVAEARQSLAELKPKLAQVRIDTAAGAQIEVDDRAVGFTPLARIIWVLPGRHRVAIKHPNYAPSSLEVAVSAGEIRTVAPQLLPAGRVATPVPPAPAPAPVVTAAPVVTETPVVTATPVAPAPPAPNVAAGKPWYFWTAAAATVAFAGGAVVAGLSANGMFNDLQKGCGATTAGCSDSQINGLKSRATLANVLWILAGASAVAAGVTFYFDGRESRASVALRF
jgi:hypothetical protein